MTCQHHMIEQFAALPTLDADLRGAACIDAVDGAHRDAQARVRDRAQHLVHILPRASLDGVPLRPSGDLQQAVVVAETHKSGEREVEHLCNRTGPDAAGHRQQVPVAEFGAVIVVQQVIAQRKIRQRVAGLFEQRGGLLVEAQDVFQHADEAFVEQVAALGEHGVQAAARPFQHAFIELQLDRKRHIGADRADAQFAEQFDQVGISVVVEHQKAGIDAVGDAVQRHVDRVRVAAEIIVCLEQGDVVPGLRQLIGAGQAGDPGADDGDLHVWQSCIHKTVLDKNDELAR